MHLWKYKKFPASWVELMTSIDAYVLARANNGLELVIEGISTLSQYSECNMRDRGKKFPASWVELMRFRYDQLYNERSAMATFSGLLSPTT
jgi:hypothetical protein